MPNTAQQELLDSFIAGGGIYFETIRYDEAFNLGTKILYLERSISQDCQTFNQSLDKLYNPDLVDEPKAAHIEFIRALKLINDLCFNNNVKYGQYGTRAALTHYFGSLGAVDANDFRTTIQATINARITALSEEHEERVTEQKQARQTAEADIVKHVGWRTELDLPLAQLAPRVQHFAPGQVVNIGSDVITILGGTLTGEQYQQLSAELRQVIAGNANATRRLIQYYGATFAQIQALSAQELQELFNQSYQVAQLVKGDIPLAHLLQLDQAVRFELFNHSYQVVWLVNKGNIPLADLVQLDPAVRTEFFTYSFQVAWLVNKGNIPLADLVQLDPAVRTELFNQSYQVVRLVNEGNLSLEQLTGLPVEQLRTLIAAPNSEAAQQILNPPSSSFRPGMF